MPAAPRILTGNLTDIGAAPASGVGVTFSRQGVSAQYGDVVIPQNVRTVTTSGGAISQQLYPGTYRGRVQMNNGPAVFTFTLTEDGPTDLAELLEEREIETTAQIVLDTRAARDAAIEAKDDAIAAVAAVPLLRDAFSTVQDLRDDETLTYANTVENQVIPAGGFRYQRAASTATDHHVTTAGGVKLYVLPGADGAYNVLAFGAQGDSATNDTAAIQSAMNAAAADSGEVFIPDGSYLVSGVTFAGDVRIRMSPNGVLLADANDVTILSCTSAFYSSLHNVRVNGNGFTGVKGFGLRNFRHTSVLLSCEARACATGFGFDELCWNTGAIKCYAVNCDIGYDLTDAANMSFFDCGSDSFGAVTPTAGMRIRNGTRPTARTIIMGGFHQGTVRGIDDAAENTTIIGTYFEQCSEADVYLGSGSDFAFVEATHHSSNSGPVCIKGESAVGAVINYPALIGTRTGGLFDFDGTNTFCRANLTHSSGINTSFGTTTGISVDAAAIQSDTLGRFGFGGPPVSGYLLSMLFANGANLRAAEFGTGAAFGQWADALAMRWNATGSHRFFAGTAGSEVEQFRIEPSGVVSIMQNSGQFKIRDSAGTAHTLTADTSGRLLINGTVVGTQT
jgi:hypothetical protein